MRYRATPDFWYHYRQLPDEIQELANRCYELLKQDSWYPSLHLKKVGSFWSVRIGIHYFPILNYDHCYSPHHQPTSRCFAYMLKKLRSF